LIAKRAMARQERRIELIDRRKWIGTVKYLRIGGNEGLYGSLPPILMVLKMQGRLLLDINGCGVDALIDENNGGVNSNNYDDSDNSSGGDDEEDER
jgi:hypothetical protein